MKSELQTACIVALVSIVVASLATFAAVELSSPRVQSPAPIPKLSLADRW